MNTEEIIKIATIKVLDKEGLEGITTKKIAKEANVSEVTIFRKFKTKNNLINISKEYYIENFLEKIDEILQIDESKNIREALEYYWNSFLKVLNDNLKLIRISVGEVHNDTSKENLLPRIFNKIISKLKKIFDDAIEKGDIRKINSEVAALTIFGIIFEATILWKIYENTPEKSNETNFDDFIDIFLNGISIKQQ